MDAQKKLQELSDNYQGLQAGMYSAANRGCRLTSHRARNRGRGTPEARVATAGEQHSQEGMQACMYLEECVLSGGNTGIRHPRRRCEHLQADRPGAAEAGQDGGSHVGQRSLGIHREADVSGCGWQQLHMTDQAQQGHREADQRHTGQEREDQDGGALFEFRDNGRCANAWTRSSRYNSRRSSSRHSSHSKRSPHHESDSNEADVTNEDTHFASV
jgi:hypothetical protein